MKTNTQKEYECLYHENGNCFDRLNEDEICINCHKNALKEALNNQSPQIILGNEVSKVATASKTSDISNSKESRLEDKTPKSSDGHSLKEDRGSNVCENCGHKKEEHETYLIYDEANGNLFGDKKEQTFCVGCSNKGYGERCQKFQPKKEVFL